MFSKSQPVNSSLFTPPEGCNCDDDYDDVSYHSLLCVENSIVDYVTFFSLTQRLLRVACCVRELLI